MNIHALISGLLLALFSVHCSFACQGKSVILDENFKSPESGWPSPSDTLSYGPSGAVFKLPTHASARGLNTHYTSDGIDLCATGIWPASGTDENLVGVAFWAKEDGENYYVATITNMGTIFVHRIIAATTGQLIFTEPDDKHAGLIHKQPGDTNEVEVQIAGHRAILWVNGKKIFDFAGQPPSGSGYVGIFSQRRKADGNGGPIPTVTVTKFRIATYP